jgi:signal peptidase I
VAAILGMAAIGAWAIMTDRISYVVTDGTSMNPVYFQGDLVFAVKADSYHVGQIVAYHGESPGQRVLHRIIGGSGSAGFVMKGDNNQSIDPLTPTTEELIGRAVLHIPHGGIWLRPLLGPSGLGMLSFLVLSGGVAKTRTRREIPRGRRKKKVKAMSSRRGGSWGAATAVLKAVERLSPLLRTAAAVAAVLTLLALTLGILGWMKPILKQQTLPKGPSQSITYSYSAKVPKSAAYDDTTVSSPDPIFRKLADRADLRTRYDGPAGTFTLTATLTNGTGWHTALTLVKKTPFTGTSFDATIPLDFRALVARADDAARVIGASPSGAVAIALSARVTSPGLADLSAPLQLNVAQLQMAPGGGAKFKTETETAASEITVPRELTIFGHSLMTASQARSDAILFLIGAAAIAAVVLLVALRRMPVRTRAEIERRYANLLVHVEPMASPPGKPVVNVNNFPALVRLSERYGQMILTWRRPDADDFVVRDEGITYRYRVPLDEPTLQNVELINRPTSGSHRRTAPSQVS